MVVEVAHFVVDSDILFLDVIHLVRKHRGQNIAASTWLRSRGMQENCENKTRPLDELPAGILEVASPQKHQEL